MNTGFQLFQLQEIDSAIDKAQKRIDEITHLIENDKTTATARKNVENCEKLFIKEKNEFEILNSDIQSRKNKKAQSESSLYSGTISNPKELQDLQKEIGYLTAMIAEMEDQLFQKMIILEKAESNFNEAKSQLKIALSEFETRKSLLIGEMNQLESSVKSQQNQRLSITTQIDQQAIGTYQSLRKSKNGIAIARLDDDTCSACGTSLNASQRQQSRSPGTLFFCPSCGRIIYGS